MKKTTTTTLALVLIACFAATAMGQSNVIERRKLAQTGFKFMSMSVDARAAGMADALTADEMGSSTAMFYNPAGMANLKGSMLSANAGVTQWIADINYNQASIAFSPRGGAMGTFGVSLLAVDYGEFIGTVRSSNENGYSDFEELGMSNPSPTAFLLGVGYAKQLSDRFAVGANVKYAKQDLGETMTELATADDPAVFGDYNLNTIAFDFGVLYKTGYKSLNFAMSARNFSQELIYEQDNFETPLALQIGVSMDMMDFTNMDRNMHSLRVSVDAERPRDYDEQISVGGEYLFMNTLALRAGYVFPTDEQGVNLGLGLQRRVGGFGFGADYAYTSFGVFDPVHRVSLRLAL